MKPDKQVLQYPAHRSGGGVHASSVNEVWQVDTTDMRSFSELKAKKPRHALLDRGGRLLAQDICGAHARGHRGGGGEGLQAIRALPQGC